MLFIFIKKYFHLTSGMYVYGQEFSIVKMATLQKLIEDLTQSL